MPAEIRPIQYNGTHPEWALDCPQRIREHAIAEACKAVRNAKKKAMNGGGFQTVHFRAKRDLKQGFGFDAASLSTGHVFRDKRYRISFQPTEAVPAEILEGTRIVCEGRRWFLITPIEVPQQQPETQRLSAVALDPGVRTFLTYYADGANGKLGQGDFKRIFRLCLHLDTLIAEAAKSKCRRKQRLRKAMQRLRWKITDLVGELHRKAAHFLVTRFDVIFLPEFQTQQMLGKLRSKTARMMATFAHFRFRRVLQAAAERFSTKVLIGNEAYTSKTCSYCGTIHKIGSRSVMRCCCDVDRDGNGARGFYIACFAGSRLASSVSTPVFVSNY